MTIENKDMPANPIYTDSFGYISEGATGLTKREKAVLMFMQAMISNPSIEYGPERFVEVAINFADEAFAEMEKTK